MIQARVLEEWSTGRIRVLLLDPETQLVFGPERTYQSDELPPGADLPSEAFALSFSRQYADLIMGALTEHFAGEKPPGDAYALRRDLDHEKTRVDKLLDFAIEAARAPRTPER